MEVKFGEINGSVSPAPVEKPVDNVEENTVKEPEKPDPRVVFITQAISGTVILGGRTFRYSMPSPFDGCVIDNHLSAYRAPFHSLASNALLPVMPPDVLKEFMKASLKNCAEKLSSGSNAAVVDEDGQIGINNESGPLLATLTEGYILFFVQNWVKESPLALNPEG